MIEPQLLTDVPPAWNALAQSHPAATAAHRPEVWQAFASSMHMDVRFVAARAGDEFLGGAGALIERRAGLRWMHSMPMLLPGAPLAVDGHAEAVDVAAARGFGELQRTLGVVGGEWALYRPGRDAPDDATLAAVAGETRRIEAALIELGDGLDAALKRMDRKTRQDVRRAAKRLQFAEEPDALDEAYTLYVRQAKGWRGHRALPLELSRRLLATGEQGQPCARLFTVRDARGLLSATLALDHPNETMLWWSGSHANARQTSAFPVLLWSVIAWAHEAGRTRVNLGASAAQGGVETFKHTLGAEGYRYPVRWMDATYAPILGRAVAALQSRVRRRRSRGIVG